MRLQGVFPLNVAVWPAKPMNDQDYEYFDLLQDILEEVINGRTDHHKCPFCRKGELAVTVDEAYVHMECPHCGKTFDGQYG